MTQMLTDVNIHKTEELLGAVLRASLHGAERVQFLVEPGRGQPTVQRCRVMLSRSRKRNRARGKKIIYFRLNSTIHPYTDKLGKRHDCVVMWTQKTESNQFDELLEDMLDKKIEGVI